MGIHQLGERKFRVQIRRKGFPAYDKVFTSRERAEAAEAEVLGQQQRIFKPADLTLKEAWKKYCASHDFEGKPWNTRRTEIGRIKPVLEELGDYSLKNLEEAPHLVMDYIDLRARHISEKTKRRLSATSIRLEIAALSSVAAWAVARRYIRTNFARHVGRPGLTKRKRRVPPIEQVNLQNAVLAVDEPKLAEAARFALLLRHLGCRPGELAKLKRCDVNLRRREATFRATKFKEQDRLVHATEKSVSLMDAQLWYAKEHAPHSEYMFSTLSRQRSPDGEPVWVPYAYATAVKRLRAYGVVDKDFHAHAMRREFISRAIEEGLPYSTIRKQTGHHSTQAIEIYDEGLSTAREIREALEKHEKNVEIDQQLAMLENMGLTGDALEAFRAFITGEKHQDRGRVFATDFESPPNPEQPAARKPPAKKATPKKAKNKPKKTDWYF